MSDTSDDMEHGAALYEAHLDRIAEKQLEAYRKQGDKMGQRMRVEIAGSTKMERPQSDFARHHKEDCSWGIKINGWQDDWINLFGFGHARPNKGDVITIDLNSDSYKAKDGSSRVSYWADLVPDQQAAPQAAANGPQWAAPPPKAPDLGPSPYSTGYNAKREDAMRAQAIPIGNLIPRQPDNRIPWADLERVARQAHLLAVQLEPDHRDEDIFDRSSARFAFVDTILIAYTNNKLQPPPLAEEIDPFAGDANDEPPPFGEDDIRW